MDTAMNATSSSPDDGHTLNDVLRSGMPYGKEAMRMIPAHWSFYSCIMGAADSIAQDILARGGPAQMAFDKDNRSLNDASWQVYNQIMEHMIGMAHKKPADIVIDAKTMNGLVSNLICSATNIATFYENAVPALVSNMSCVSATPAGQAVTVRLRDEFKSLSQEIPAEAKAVYKYYDHDTMGGNAGAYAMCALHLAATKIDPAHGTPNKFAKPIMKLLAGSA